MRIVILDDGRGYDVDEARRCAEQQGSLGLVNMRERTEFVGGELTVRSAPGQGTCITIEVPLAEEERIMTT
jgi:two-component system sensor histidine kinase UhpB